MTKWKNYPNPERAKNTANMVKSQTTSRSTNLYSEPPLRYNRSTATEGLEVRMKKLTRRGFTAAGIVAAIGMAGVFSACRNRPEAVYGPPEGFDPKNNEIEDVYGPPGDFEPDNNEIEGVYGPPEDLGLEPVDPEKSDGDNFDPGENELEDVYGPPEDFEPDNNEIEGVYGPPDFFGQIDQKTGIPFAPSDNEPTCVYGPPEWFQPGGRAAFDASQNTPPPVYGPPSGC